MSTHGPGPVPPPDQLSFDLPGLRTTPPHALLQAVSPDPGPDRTPARTPAPRPDRPPGGAVDTDAPEVVATLLRAVDMSATDLSAVTQTPELFTLDGPPLSTVASEPVLDRPVVLPGELPPVPGLLGPSGPPVVSGGHPAAARVWLVWEDDELLGVYADPAVAETDVDTLRRNARRTRTQVSYELLAVPVFDSCRHRRATAAGPAIPR